MDKMGTRKKERAMGVDGVDRVAFRWREQ